MLKPYALLKIKYAILRASRVPRAPRPGPAAQFWHTWQGLFSAQRLLAACFCFSSHVLLCTATSECMAAARSACPIAS